MGADEAGTVRSRRAPESGTAGTRDEAGCLEVGAAIWAALENSCCCSAGRSASRPGRAGGRDRSRRFTRSPRFILLDHLEELGVQVGKRLHASLLPRRTPRTTAPSDSSRRPFSSPQNQSLAPRHPGPLVSVRHHHRARPAEFGSFLLEAVTCSLSCGSQELMRPANPVLDSFSGPGTVTLMPSASWPHVEIVRYGREMSGIPKHRAAIS